MNRTRRTILVAAACIGATAVIAPPPVLAEGQCVGFTGQCKEVPFTYWNGFEWVESSFWLIGTLVDE